MERFWSRVDRSGECWIWNGSKQSGGYGQISINNKMIYAHRYSFYLANGFYPKEVLHTCDNPSCVNPQHLRGGTHQDNMKDMANKGRWISPNSKKVACPQGHEYNNENTRVGKDNRRHCRVCDREKRRYKKDEQA